MRLTPRSKMWGHMGKCYRDRCGVGGFPVWDSPLERNGTKLYYQETER